MSIQRAAYVIAASLAIVACQQQASDVTRGDDLRAPRRLPTGNTLDPVGVSFTVGQMPLGMIPSPDGRRLVLVLGGYRTQGLQVVDPVAHRVVQELPQASSFFGAAFSADGQWLFASGGNQDVVYRYRWAGDRATLADSIILAVKQPVDKGTRYPAGIAVSADGTRLYVAENLADSLAVIDVATRTVVQRLPTERYPYAVVVAPDGTVWVSAWGGNTVSMFPAQGSRLGEGVRVPVARHPSALLLNKAGTRLFIASASTDRVVVLDTRTRQVVSELRCEPPGGVSEGSTPNALALSWDESRLFVAEADNNAVAIFDLSVATSGAAHGTPGDVLAGRIPVQWYPTALVSREGDLFVANGKGAGTAPNVGPASAPGPTATFGRGANPRLYTLGQYDGSLTTFNGALLPAATLAPLTFRVVRANGWASTERRGTTPAPYPPIRHVIYVIKENRTYDQVFSDLPQGDGDTTLLFFPRSVTPNHHALAERFGLYDRFFVNAEVSPDGHNWSTAAYTTDYLQKTVPSNYSRPSRGRSYDYEGTNRGIVPPDGDDVAAPAAGYLWNLAERAKLPFRNYGEFVIPEREFDPEGRGPAAYRGNKPFLRENTSPGYPGYSMRIQDQVRADVWIEELEGFVRSGSMPALEVVRLPNDHTEGAVAGRPTPRAHVADNDLALGRMVEALSKTPFWESTAMFVLEDDAQNGMDHVDSHRSLLLVISPWAAGGVVHRFVNTTDVLATIEEILGLPAMSQFDRFGRPLRGIWRTSPDTRPYVALRPAVPLDERNPAGTRGARESAALDLADIDRADEDLFNRILWYTIKGEHAPFPGATHPRGLGLRAALDGSR